VDYKRLIPVLLIKDGLLVRSQLFKYHQAIGDPIPTIKRLSDWNVDEIILINIGSDNAMDSRRNDKWHNLGKGSFYELVSETSRYCNCPLSIGGGINDINILEKLFQSGADKCIINTCLFEKPELVIEAVDKYGSQAIIASLDIGETSKGSKKIFINRGKKELNYSLAEAIDYVKDLKVGEIFISSINNDGSAKGYEKQILESLNKSINMPVIINSGATKIEHFNEALLFDNISAVAASNVFYFTELSYPIIKQSLIDLGHQNLRKPNLESPFIHREPTYNQSRKLKLLKKLDSNIFVNKKLYDGKSQVKIRYCNRCLYSSLSATPMQFDSDGVCMGCRVYDTKRKQGEERYKELSNDLYKIIETNKNSGNYDCIVSVSGGKDSYYQTHFVTKVLGLKALLVTYNGNNYTDVGWRNLWKMREVFNCDHVIISPSVDVLKKLNKIGFTVMGDMNWHAHVGIFTTAPRIAIQHEIPIIFWGEHGYADLCGQFSMSDFPEMNYRERTEHAGRGFDWEFFLGIDGLTDKDLEPWKYPSDIKLFKSKLRQIYLGHYIPWESNEHLKLVIDNYGFEVSSEPFERTYRTGSNLDDMHENGVHDYLKYVKFGYGRCTDHASKDIRSGEMNRKEGIDLANKMDPIKPKDLGRWLEYVNMSEEEFDRIADHFRDPRVWKWDSNKWSRDVLS
tara:strand:- start:274 stop:2316 length:2043 start_codon:yes stop_codon:yes gene_type:complete